MVIVMLVDTLEAWVCPWKIFGDQIIWGCERIMWKETNVKVTSVILGDDFEYVSTIEI